MKKWCIIFFVVITTVIVYIYFADKVNVSNSKVDTLYMVSTIFYSAVIGMVISNNVHLENVHFRNEIRKYYQIQRNLLTVFFIITTTLYFVLDIHLFQYISNRLGINLPLLTLCVIILFIFYNLVSMRAISSGVAKIEDNDLTTEDEEIKRNEILEYLKDFDETPLSKTQILKIIDVANTKNNEDKYIIPLVNEGLLKQTKRGNTNYYKYQIQKYGKS